LATPTGRLSRPMNHPNKPSNETPDEFIRGKDDFDMFWNSYPLKVGKAAAKRAWDKAITIDKPDVIIMGAYRYALDPNRHPSFTAHASTWLNAGRWADAPLPPRMLSPEEKRVREIEESKAKTDRERQAYLDWQQEIKESQERAVPVPEHIKELLKKTLPKR
jgi:hypothetical protein